MSVKKMLRMPSASCARNPSVSSACHVFDSSVNIVTEIGMAKIEKGLQVAAINSAEELTGVQIGAINIAHECRKGLQIGVINIVLDNKVKILPIANGYFGSDEE
jgi:hypothetical protein